MRARILAMVVGGVSALTATLVACASDEDAVLANPDGGNSALPGGDGGADALAEDAQGELSDTCLPDSLCPNGPFDPNMPGGPLDSRTRIHFIVGRSATDVWAAGANGTMAHFDGTSWTRSDVGTIETMHALWLREKDEIALASLGSIYTRGLATKGDASAPSAGGWTASGAPTSLQAGNDYSSLNVTSSWIAPGAEWLWLTSQQAHLKSSPPLNGLWRLRVNSVTRALELGAALPERLCAARPCGHMTSIHGASADDLWAVGYTGAAFHITNAQSDTPAITQFESRTWASLNGVWVASANDAWAVGGAGTIRHYTGHSYAWDVVADVPTKNHLNAVWGSSATDIWAVGEGAVVLHYDGKAWSTVEVRGLGDRRPDLRTVWTPAPGHVWVGGDGVILSLGGKGKP